VVHTASPMFYRPLYQTPNYAWLFICRSEYVKSG
jgi:hypothetical protein